MIKKIIFVCSFIFLTVAIVVAVISSDNFLLFLGEIVGISSKISGGDYTVQQVVKPLGTTKMLSADGVYELRPDISAITSKLAQDLTQTHCYPNPYKPSRGHKGITFSRLTQYTKLKVFNIAGELVYEEERDTPLGELFWNVVNNNDEKLASGVYIYLITNDKGQIAKGRFAVIK